MNQCGSRSVLLVNAEVDSMGGVIDGGVGIGIKTSPHRATIEKAQAELRQEYDVREERRRELEFLEKGGNPLDFKFGNVASVSVQSTSLIDHHTEHFASEAKGSFALTASPHGDSVESSGRPGAPTVCEPISADNFDGENELRKGERNLKHPNRRKNIAPSEQSSQVDGTQNPKESEDSAIFHSYARRNRSKPNRDAARSSATDMAQSSGGHGSSLPLRGGSRDTKGSISDTSNQKDQIIPFVSIPKSTISNGDVVTLIETSNTQLNMDLDGAQVLEATTNLPKDSLNEDRLDTTDLEVLRDNQHDQPVELLSQMNHVAMEELDHVEAKEQVIPAVLELPPCTDTTKIGNNINSPQMNGFSDLKSDGNEDQNVIAAPGTNGLDSRSSCSQNNNLSLDVNDDKNSCNNVKNDIDNGISMKQTSEIGEMQNSVLDKNGNEKDERKADDNCPTINDHSNLVHQNHSGNDFLVKVEGEVQRSTELENEVDCPPRFEETKQNEHDESEADGKVSNLLDNVSVSNREIICPGGLQASTNSSIQEPPECTLSEKDSSVLVDPQPCSVSCLKLTDKAHEDSILEEARIIEAKRKRIAELSIGTIPVETRCKSQWDFVLEEMAWLANDFAQERLWKITAAAQICRRVAFTCRSRVEEQNHHWKLKKVAHTLAKAVTQFWHSAEALLNNDHQSIGVKNCKYDSPRLDDNIFSEKLRGVDKDACKELQNPQKNIAHAIQGYAVRFLKFNSSPVPFAQAEAPATPDRIADLGRMEISWDDHLTEESLFYAVSSGAMETYRISIESHLPGCEKPGSSTQEEVETSMHDPSAEVGYHENAYDEEEGETSTYYLQEIFEGNKPTKHNQKKRNNSMKSYPARSYEPGIDSPYGHSTIGSQQNTVMGKRPANNLHVGSFPTKRIRTASASRQRVIYPFTGAGGTGDLQAPTKTDASSGDTNSFQDDQSSLHGGYGIQKSMEVESVGNFERQLPYDTAEISTKPKKKKKHVGTAYEQGWQLDSTVHNELRGNTKRRQEDHHFDSNRTSGLYGQHSTKKPKIMKQMPDSTYDNMASMRRSIPSPAASQMSNMSNTNRFIKLINGRDRSRKTKSLKIPAGQPGSGSPWTLFEDQALVVLVHDLGPNWELVSDAINSTVQFKCTSRKPLECKERHKILMDKSAGDGADSADDSGSSQSYPSTLPGIPKGSATQLFQRLQGPMLEDTLRSHFEKIIVIGKKQHYRRNQDPRQKAAVHNSHVIALTHVCPNNLNGGVLTPLDLCETTASSPDIHSLGFQGPHAGGLPMPNQGSVASLPPTSTTNSSLQGFSGMALGNNCASPPAPPNAPVRDGRYNVSRTSLSVDEQQRMQHYNQMLSSRKLEQSNLPVSSALSGDDRSVRMLPGGGNGMGAMPGMNRSIPLSKPGYQGITSSPVMNSGSMLSSNPVGMHSGTSSGQGNSMMRPSEALHMMRPGHSPEHQRQMMVPEVQMQVTRGNNSQGIPSFNGVSSGFANHTTPPPVQTYSGHNQQHQMSVQQSHVLSNAHHPHLQGANHVAPSQQQAYAIRLAKERQMQQRLLQQQPQQQQQLAASSALMPHVQIQPQLSTSSSVQISPQIQSQASSQAVSMPPSVPSSPSTPLSVQQQRQQLQKHNLPHNGLNRNIQTGAVGLNNQMGKQQQRHLQHQQQFQQSGRHHPSQRQQLQSSQQAKLLKGMGRGNTIVHQNLPKDSSHLNGPPGNQVAEKGEQIMHLMQGQGLQSGTSLSSMQPSNLSVPLSSNHSQPQQVFSGSTPPSTKPLQKMPSHSDNRAEGSQVHSIPSCHAVANSHRAVPSPITASSHQHLQSQQPQPHQKQVIQTQSPVKRMSQQNHLANADLPSKSQMDQCHTDRKPISNVSQMGTSTTIAMPHTNNDSVNAALPVVSSAVASQRKSSACTPASLVGSIGSPSLTKLAGSEPPVSVTQGLGPRQLSGGLTQHGHNAGLQWQQSQLVQSTIPRTPSQQQFQPQEQQLLEQEQSQHHLLLQKQSQQQAHLQSAQGSMYTRPTNSKLE